MDYTIQQGDTLGAIAKKYNTDVNTLAKANNIANPNLIQAGAKLAIPSISAEKISTTPISIPPVPPPTKDPNAFVTSLQSQIQPLQQASDTASTNVNTAQQDLITLQKQLEGKTAEQIKLENEQNIPQINTELVGLQSEAQRLTTEYLNAIRNREAQGGVAAVVGADQKRIQSQAASDIGLLNAQIQAKQGQLELARGTVDRAIAIKYEPLIQSIETKKLIYEMNKDSLSRADQKLLEAKNKEWNLQLDKYKKEQEDAKSMQDMIIDAQAQGAPASVISSAQLVIKNGGTPAQVAVAIGKYSGAAAKAELLKQQIKTEKAQQSKYYAEAKQASMPGGGKPPTVDQVANAGYASRFEQANAIIDSKADTFKNMNYANFALASSNSQLANKLLSADQRQAAQAMRNFITAKLRKESGASISPSEFADARVQYFPALGDDEQTLKNKKALRDSVLQNAILGAGSAYQKSPIESYLDTVTNSLSSDTKADSSAYAKSIYNSNKD